MEKHDGKLSVTYLYAVRTLLQPPQDQDQTFLELLVSCGQRIPQSKSVSSEIFSLQFDGQS